MNRQWMHSKKRTSKYIKGVHNFLEVAEANKQNGFMCFPCPICGNTSLTLTGKSFTATCFRRVSCDTIMFGPSTEKEVLWWKTMKKKKMMKTIQILYSLNTVILQRGKLKIKRHQLCRMMIFARSFLMHREGYESEREKLKFDRMWKWLYPNCKDGNTKLGTTLELLQWKA